MCMKNTLKEVLQMKKAVMIIICLVMAGCSTKVRPVLYPNAQLSKVGQEQAQLDIAACCAMADAYVKNEKAKEIVKDAAKAGTIGAATGAAAGAVWGHAGKGAAAGAAGGAAAAAVSGMFKVKDPSPVYKNFVDRCLREKGYETIGWE
jgi:hypothetical protein